MDDATRKLLAKLRRGPLSRVEANRLADAFVLLDARAEASASEVLTLHSVLAEVYELNEAGDCSDVVADLTQRYAVAVLCERLGREGATRAE
jgi:hypothetical protein